MIITTQDKKDYIETIQVDEKESLSSPLYDKIEKIENRESLKFKYKFINKKIKESKFLLEKSENPRSLTQLGDVYLLNNKYKKAIECFLMAIDSDTNFIVAYEKLVLAYSANKNFVKANEYFSKLIKITNRNPDILHRYSIFKAFIDQSNKDPDEALSVLNEVLEKHPDNFEVLNTFGFILLNAQKKIEESKTYFLKALKYNNSYIHSINNLGVCFLHENNIKESQKQFIKVIELAPDYLFSYQNLAFSYIKEEKYEMAYEILLRAKYRQIILDNAWDHKIGWLLIKLNRIDEAIDWYQQKIKNEFYNYLLFNNLGVCFMLKNNIEQAEREFKKAIDLFTKSNQRIIFGDQLKPFYNLGRVAINKQDDETVSKVADVLLKLNPTDAYALYLKGASFLLAENYSKAKEFFEKSLEITKNIPEIYPDYAFILDTIDRDYKSAIKLLNGALKEGYKSSYIDNDLAFAYIQDNQLEEAEKILKKYKTDDIIPALLATKGLLEIRKGDLDKGTEFYEKCFKLFKTKNLNIAQQILFCERSLYWINKKEIKRAQDELFKAKVLPISYINSYISDIQKKIDTY